MKHVVVTGGSSGVGEALVSRLTANGHRVYNLDVAAPGGWPDGLDGVEYIACDLADESAIDDALSALPMHLDALANVAGIAQAAAASRVLAINFLGLRHLTSGVEDRLTPGGAVVCVSSIAGRDWASKYAKILPLLETTSMKEGIEWVEANNEWIARDPYTVSKRCVTAYTLRKAQQMLDKGLRINCVSPGVIDTPLYPQFESLMGEAQSHWLIAQAGRSAKPGDIAEVLEFLTTGDCGWLNGVDIPVDGGYTAGVESGWIDFNQSPLMVQRTAAKASRS